MLTTLRHRLWLLCLAFLLATPGVAQTGLVKAALPRAAAPQQPAAPSEESPRDGALALMAACRTHDSQKAEFYLDLRQVRSSERKEEALVLACQAKAVLDRLLPTNLAGLSNLPTGDLNDNMPANIDHLVTATTSDGPVSLYMERYTDKAGQSRWRLNAASVEKVPALYDEFGLESWERDLPAFVVKHTLFDIKLWQWAALAVLLLVIIATSRLAAKVLQSLVVRILGKLEHGQLLKKAVHRASHPFRLLLGLGLLSLGLMPIDFSLGARQRLSMIEGAFVIVIVTWFLINLVDAAAELARLRWTSRDRAGSVALLPLMQRIGRAFLCIVACLILLQTFGVNVTAVLAGLGVGGLAVALAAQKTVENFFGGMMIAIDQPVRVGDYCRFGAQTGTVEDIGLRSTRLRTPNRTLVTIPNGEFSQLQIENISKRDKISFTGILGIECLTSTAKIRELLLAVRAYLGDDPRIDQATLEVRLINLGGQSIDLEIFGYILTTDFRTFKEVREELYLHLMEMVEERGLVFSLPSNFNFNRSTPEQLLRDAAKQKQDSNPSFPGDSHG